MRNIKHLLAFAAGLSMLCACDSNSGPDSPTPGPGEDVTVDAPVDSKPSSTSFDRKVLLVDFTGNGCQYCPNMTKALKSVLAKSAYSKKAVLAVAHTYNNDDPAYFDTNLQTVMGVKAYPTLTANLNTSNMLLYNDASELNLQNFIDNAASGDVVAGVAANSKIVDRKLYVRVNVKAGSPDPKEFRVALWLLEDGIYGKQAGKLPDDSYNTHDSCVRTIIGKTTETNFFGVKTEPSSIASGEIGDVTFVVELKDSWATENLKYVVAVSAPDLSDKYYVCNAGVAKAGSSIAYSYSK